jgi:hypothetical protein
MAEGEARHMSPRGAFFIGLALGLGVAFIIFARQKTGYEGEIDKMKHDLELTTKMVAEDHAELAKLKSDKK